MKYYTEIYFTQALLEECDWENLCHEISDYLGFLAKWKLIVSFEDKLHYYIESKIKLPISFSKVDKFLLKPASYQPLKGKRKIFSFGKVSDTLLELYNRNQLKKRKQIKQAEIKFYKISDKLFSTMNLHVFYKKELRKERIFISLPFSLLQIDFGKEKQFGYQKANFLDIKKSLALLTTEKANPILEVDSFPYIEGETYLDLSHYDFDKHSLIVGASGTGKSKLMGLITSALSHNTDLKNQYKIVIIDPHANLKEDIGGLEDVSIIDFEKENTSISLFSGKKEDALATTELYLSLFSTLLNGYNAKLERVLRHSIYLLLYIEDFTFMNMKKLLLDLEYRLQLLKEHNIPISINQFFMGDFNELKNQSYSEAIAPIISFLDEMELVFQNLGTKTLKEQIDNNFVTIFSLDSMKLGTHTIKTISGFLMQQMLYVAMQKEIDEHIIFMVDEVSVLENPVLSRMLSEARKYGLSLVLAEQYFDQISEALKNSIFANVQNYYVFRVSIKDAEELKNHLEMNIDEDKKIKLLSTLKDRECIVRLYKKGTLYPAMKAKTCFLKSVPYQKIIYDMKKDDHLECKQFSFNMNATTSIGTLLKSISSSRKKVF